MKQLYLIRHAKSSWDHYGLLDIERPLNERGKNDAPLMGQMLREKSVHPDLLLSSPATRALHTALIIARETGYDRNVEINKKIYEAYPSDLWLVAKSVPDDVVSLMLFGHNPSLTEFANELTDVQIDNIPTCGIFAVAWKVKKWSELEKKGAQLIFYEYPKKIK